jgi:hypothetical protein
MVRLRGRVRNRVDGGLTQWACGIRDMWRNYGWPTWLFCSSLFGDAVQKDMLCFRRESRWSMASAALQS